MWLLSHFAQLSFRFVYVIYSSTHFFVLSLDAIIMFRHVRLCHKRKSLNWCSRKVTCSLKKKVTDDAHWNKLYNFEIWFYVGFFRPLCVCVLSISLCLFIFMFMYISNGTKDFNRKLLMIIWHKLIFVPFFCITRQFMDEYWTKSHFCQCILYSGEMRSRTNTKGTCAKIMVNIANIAHSELPSLGILKIFRIVEIRQAENGTTGTSKISKNEAVVIIFSSYVVRNFAQIERVLLL